MSRHFISFFTAALFAACTIVGDARAAAPAAAGVDRPEPGAPVRIFELDTEIVVHNWVMCISQAFAEELVRARAEGVEQARSAYAGLSKRRRCGRFAELSVILRERLYSSPVGDDGRDAGVFAAEIRMADKWASVFVVYGGLPEQPE